MTGGMIAGDTLMSGPVKLPEALRQAPETYLCDVTIGETVLVSFVKMQVNAEGYCFLDPAAKIVDNHLNAIRVERRADGYHVTVPSDLRWKPRDFETDGWYAVASITQTEDWRLGERDGYPTWAAT